jgi:hypothetical protein
MIPERAARSYVIIGVVVWGAGGLLQAEKHTAASPNGRLKTVLECDLGRLYYEVSLDGRVLLQRSAISIVPDASYRITGTKTGKADQTWQPVWGQFSSIRDHYRELSLELEAGGLTLDLICRSYDDGVGLRFAFPRQPRLQGRKLDYRVDFLFEADYPMYHPGGEVEPRGPVPISAFDPNARGPSIPALAALGKELPGAQIPAVIELAQDRYVALLESDLFTAVTQAETGTMELAPAERQPGLRSVNAATVTGDSYVTPWRVVLTAAQPGELPLNPVPLNLAPPDQVGKPSWVKPGKCIWDWLNRGYHAGDFTYGADTASYKRLIDFGSQNNLQYLLVDWQWYRVRNGEFVVIPAIDVREVISYARSKGVGVILYWDDYRGGTLPMDEVFGLYSSWGAVGVKYGFRCNDAEFTAEAIRKAAAHKLMIDFHDKPCPMVGVSRTYPNAVSREYCHAQLDANRVSSATAFLKMAMINAITGPLDMNEGFYSLHPDPAIVTHRARRLVLDSTAAGENARVLIAATGLTVLPDAPEEYRKKADLFEFIAKMPPADWDETRVLKSKLVEYLSLARRKGREWFVGTSVNEKGGVLELKLDFLSPATSYDVTFYEDAPDTHYQTNRESYRVRRGKVKKDDLVKIAMAPGGGHTMWIRPEEVSSR